MFVRIVVLGLCVIFIFGNWVFCFRCEFFVVFIFIVNLGKWWVGRLDWSWFVIFFFVLGRGCFCGRWRYLSVVVLLCCV